ncbi:hypothetical protein C8035_v004831 [Colletotrichum spinosum]|uniref:Secreted protein n=1 Tax=Colletotrichum spinosum TaxID=1347390 RepID=A0A4R8Q1P5_9PEZI|nr:hypothetical protein C8035_v004831 [Colletotrichum spinosum]
MKSFATIVLAVAAAATGVMSAAVNKHVEKRVTGADLKFCNDVVNSAAYEPFKVADVRLASGLSTRQTIPEPDPNRNATVPDVVFLLQCTDSVRVNELVSYFSFNGGNTTDVSDTYNDKVTSLSTNTGGKCQFYKFKGCNNKGDDRGLTSSYNYNLAVPLPDDPRTVEYEDQITSWRC